MLRSSANSLKKEKVAASGRILLSLLQQPQSSIAQNVTQVSIIFVLDLYRHPYWIVILKRKIKMSSNMYADIRSRRKN